MAILAVLRSALVQVGARLMDVVNPDLVRAARHAVGTADDSSMCGTCVVWIGHTPRAEADVTVAAELPVQAGHDIAHHAEAHLLDSLPQLSAATVHVSPAGAHH
jgi:divalent metal cation (Fe/Co/Zn/Cd) transporter